MSTHRHDGRSGRAAIAALITWFALTAAAFGGVWYVDDDAPLDPAAGDPSISDPNEDGSAAHPFDTIQEAVDAAGDDDEIRLADGTYTGSGNRDVLISAKTLALVGASGDPNACIVDCEQQGRGFNLAGDGTTSVQLESLSILNGYVDESSPGGANGGGIRCDATDLLVANSIITNNACADGSDPGGSGGGIFAVASSVTLSGTIVDQNVAGDGANSPNGYAEGAHGGRGGGVYVEGELALDGCTVANNIAGEGGYGNWVDPNIARGGDGGGIYCAGVFVARGCRIDNNVAGAGGWNEYGPASSRDTGQSGGSGGGIWLRATAEPARLVDCAIVGNTAGRAGHVDAAPAERAGDGGGVMCFGDLTVQYCELVGNQSGQPPVTSKRYGGGHGGRGGAIAAIGHLQIDDSTLSQNQTGGEASSGDLFPKVDGGDGGAIHVIGSLTLNRSEISDNRCGSAGSMSSGAGGCGGGIFAVGGDVALNAATISRNRAGDGGSAYGAHIDPGGAGGGVYCAGNLDMVDCLIDENTSGSSGFSYSSGKDGGAGGGVWCDGRFRAEACRLIANIAGDGPSSDSSGASVANGGGGGAIRVGFASAPAVLIDCELEGNRTGLGGQNFMGHGGRGGSGGGVQCAGDLIVRGCRFTDNAALNGGQGYDYLGTGGEGGGGGAIAVVGELTVRDSAFDRNRSGDGASGAQGGSGGSGGAILASSVSIFNCTFTGNRGGDGADGKSGGVGGSGGAVVALYSVVSRSSSFVANQTGDGGRTSTDITVAAPGEGGALWCQNAATLVGCTLVLNETGGIYDPNYLPNAGLGGGAFAPTLTVRDSIVWNNVAATDPQLSAPTLTVDYSCVEGWAGGGVGNIAIDPLFADADGVDDDPNTWADNDYRLAAGSPCIDAGDPNVEAAPGEFDVAGLLRVWDGDADAIARVDMGTHEYASFAPGDLNCDGVVDMYDIDAFVLALTDVDAYAAAYPQCDLSLADCNNDGFVDTYDIDGFVALLTGG